MCKVISKTIKIISPNLPPNVDFIEKEISSTGIEPLRWAIVNAKGSELTISVSGRKLC